MAYKKRSRTVTQGVARAPNRSMGYRDEDFEKPRMGLSPKFSAFKIPALQAGGSA
jgi:hypothetical protein